MQVVLLSHQVFVFMNETLRNSLDAARATKIVR